MDSRTSPRAVHDNTTCSGPTPLTVLMPLLASTTFSFISALSFALHPLPPLVVRMPSVATRRRRAVAIQNRMEGGTEPLDEGLYPSAPPRSTYPQSSSLLTLPPSSLPSLTFMRPTLLSVAMLPLLLLMGYLYSHRSHVSAVAMGWMVALTGAYVGGFLWALEAQLQSKQSQSNDARAGGQR